MNLRGGGGISLVSSHHESVRMGVAVGGHKFPFAGPLYSDLFLVGRRWNWGAGVIHDFLQQDEAFIFNLSRHPGTVDKGPCLLSPLASFLTFLCFCLILWVELMISIIQSDYEKFTWSEHRVPGTEEGFGECWCPSSVSSYEQQFLPKWVQALCLVTLLSFVLTRFSSSRGLNLVRINGFSLQPSLLHFPRTEPTWPLFYTGKNIHFRVFSGSCIRVALNSVIFWRWLCHE